MDIRKLRRWTIALGVAVVAVTVPLAWPKAPDGMEFLREFHPQEYRTQNPFCDLMPNTPPYDPARGWYRVFRFPDMDAVKVRSELKEHAPNPHLMGELFVVLPNGRRGTYYDGQRMLALYGEPAPNWLQSKLLQIQSQLRRPSRP